jgi:DNA-binding CsgD family transcriptional regulator
MRQTKRIQSADSEQLVLSLIDDIYSAALDSGLWTSVVKRVVEAVGGTSGQLLSPTEHVLSRLWAPYGFDPNVMVPYAQYYHALDYWTIAADVKSMGPCRVFTGEELLESDNFKSTEYYNDFLKGFNFERWVGFFVEEKKKADLPKTSLSVYRPPGSEPFGGSEVKLLNAIASHVRRAVQLHGRIADLEHKQATNTEVLEHLTVGIALVDETLRVTYLNSMAQKIVNASDGLTVTGGELTAFLSAETVALSRLLGEATRATSSLDGSRSGAMTITRTTKGPPYRVTVIPVPSEGAFAVGRHHTSAIVFISETQLRQQATVDMFARIYSLSPAESRLLNVLLDGQPLKKAANFLCISVNTAHTQLANIFSKTGTHRQVELNNLVMSTATVAHS